MNPRLPDHRVTRPPRSGDAMVAMGFNPWSERPQCPTRRVATPESKILDQPGAHFMLSLRATPFLCLAGLMG